MTQIKTNWQLWGIDFPIGGEWDAGLTPPHTPTDKSGRWTVRREETRFAVFFHRFHDHSDTLLAEYPATEQGEIDAKTCAVAARQNNQTTPFQTGE
jgi:hypothetical protein